jgi:hypothetical protein
VSKPPKPGFVGFGAIHLGHFQKISSKVAAEAGCTQLRPGEIRKTRQLCNLPFWNGLTKPEQIRAGQIVSTAIDAGLLPLVKLEKSPSNHQRYQRK